MSQICSIKFICFIDAIIWWFFIIWWEIQRHLDFHSETKYKFLQMSKIVTKTGTGHPADFGYMLLGLKIRIGSCKSRCICKNPSSYIFYLTSLLSLIRHWTKEAMTLFPYFMYANDFIFISHQTKFAGKQPYIIFRVNLT